MDNTLQIAKAPTIYIIDIEQNISPSVTAYCISSNCLG